MNQTSQLLKWAIPGWVFIIFVSLWFFLGYFVSSDNGINDSFLELKHDYLDHISTDLLIIFGTTGPPIGFLIYQFYFFYKEIIWPNKYSTDPTVVLSRKYLDKLSEDHRLVDLLGQEKSLIRGLLNRIEFLKKRIERMDKYSYEWNIIKKRWMHEICSSSCNDIGREVLINRMRFLDDIHDALGAFMAAIIFAWIFALVTLLFGGIKTWLCVLATGIIFNFLIYVVLHTNRVHVRRKIFLLLRYRDCSQKANEGLAKYHMM